MKTWFFLVLDIFLLEFCFLLLCIGLLCFLSVDKAKISKMEVLYLVANGDGVGFMCGLNVLHFCIWMHLTCDEEVICTAECFWSITNKKMLSPLVAF